MPSSYSQDFRKKVMNYVNKDNSCNRAALKFEISPNTVRNWGRKI
ncbi:helix-turn-helix domain-containing protein [Candidatus Sarmatiella mevalonica]